MKRELAIGLVLLGSAAVTRAADTVPLRANAQVGQKWKFDETQSTDTANTATMNGQSQQFQSTSKAHQAGTVEVLAVIGGVPSSIRVVFDRDCAMSQTQNTNTQTITSPFAGQTVTVTRSPDGQVKDDFQGRVDPNTSSELHAAIDRDAVLMPGKPVGVGDEWPADPALCGRVLQLSGQDTGGMTLKLLGVHQDGGRPVADVKVSFAIQKNMNGIKATLISQGTDTVDLATGHVIKTDFKGTSEVSGEQQTQGPNGQPVSFQVAGKGSLAIAATAPLDDAGPIAGGDAPAPLPAPTVMGGGGVNPLSPVPSFAGSFSDGKLKVDFRPSGDAYEGTFALGGNAFPAKASPSPQPGHLTGSFVAGGTTYPFSADLSGDTLTLTSGSTTYNLKKAAANPLDGGGANPLAR